MLANKNNDADFQFAKVKIEELKTKVAMLQNKYAGMEVENKRLQLLINQLLNGKQKKPETHIKTLVEKQKITTPSVTKNEVATAGVLHLFAVAGNNGGQETITAYNTEKIIGTFTIKTLPVKGNEKLLTVVLQPDGKVIKNAVWESGTFESAQVKKVYSRKLYTETTSEEKQFNFSITPDKFLKGDYTLQIWYNGSMIAKMTKTLS